MYEIQKSWQLKYKPRAWQLHALKEWLQNQKGIVSVVTGGGKTVFSFLCILEFLQQKKKGKILIVVPTLTLLDQWQVSLQDELNVNIADIACFSGEEKPKNFSIINLFVINTGRTILPLLKDKQQYMLIVDECHRAGSPTNSKAIAGNYGATLGLSATPEREYDDGFMKYLVPSLGPIIYTYDYKQALDDQVICFYELRNIKIELLPHELNSYNAITKKIMKLRDVAEDDSVAYKKLQHLLIRRARISASAKMRLPVTSKLAEDSKGERIIIFHESIPAANTLFKNLVSRGQSATIYHSQISPQLRRDNLRLFRSGRFNILITCKALDEGMNAPETTVAIISSSTASTRQRIQRLGRVLRPSKKKQKAVIYTIFATEQERQRLINESKNLKGQVEVKWFRTKR